MYVWGGGAGLVDGEAAGGAGEGHVSPFVSQLLEDTRRLKKGAICPWVASRVWG